MKKHLSILIFLMTCTMVSAQFKQSDTYFMGTAHIASDNHGIVTLRLLQPDKYYLVEQVTGIKNDVLIPGKKYTVFLKTIPKKKNGINAIVILARYHYTTNSKDFLHAQDSISPVLKVKRYN